MARNPVELTFDQILDAAGKELHRSRHLTVAFANGEDLPGLDLGWGSGMLFGIHLALAYPKLAGKLNRAVFTIHPDHPGPNLAADIVAQAITESFFPAGPDDEDGVMDSWNKIKATLPAEGDR